MAVFFRRFWPIAPFTPPSVLPFEPDTPWAESATDAGTIFPFGLTFDEAIFFFWRVRYWSLTCSLDSGSGDLSDPPDGSNMSWTGVTAECHSGDTNVFQSATNQSRSLNRPGFRQCDLIAAANRPFINTPIFGKEATSTVTTTLAAEDPEPDTITTNNGSFTISLRYDFSGLEQPTPCWLGRKVIDDVAYYYPPMEANVSFDSLSASPVRLNASSRGSGTELANFILRLPGRDISRPLYGTTYVANALVPAPTIGDLILEPHTAWPAP